jgi:acyl transferase domain-containing protein
LPANALCGVSSFGLGGSNAHAVLGSAPAAVVPDRGATGVLTLSAPSEQALRRNADSIATALHNLDDQWVASWCRTTNVVKRSHRHRLVLDGNRDTLVHGLGEFLAGTRADLASSAPPRKVAAGVGLLCSGQGTQYPGMTRPLYDANPVYRENLDAAAAALDPYLPSGLIAAVLGDDPDLHHTSLAQPALFAVSYALGKTLLQSGIRPVFGVGHSVGEVAVACLAGVLSVDDAARLVAARGRLMGALPPGGAMIAVDFGVGQTEALVADEPGCAIAAVNGPRSVVISGAADAVARAHAAVRGQGGRAVNLTVSHAFHSPLMEPMVAEFRRQLSGLAPSPAEFRLFSTVLGREVEGQEMGTDYWATQICSPVRLFDAVRAAVGAASADYVAEAGPRSTLLTLARQCGLPPQTRSLALCAGPDSDGMELLGVAATLLRDGYSPDLSPLYGRPAGPLHRIPPYVFDSSSRFWFDGEVAAEPPTVQPATVTPVAEREQPAQVSAGLEGAVLAVIAEVGGYPAGPLTRSVRLSDDLGYDSLLQLRLFDRLRADYPQLGHIAIVEVLPKIHSVGDVVDFVVEQLGPAAGVTR